MPQQEEAPAELFAPPPGAWQADIADPDLQYADDERQRRIAGWQSLPGLGELAPLLACDPQVIRASGDLDPPAPARMIPLARRSPLLTARTNGSPTCFDAWPPHWQGEEEFASHLREGDQALHHWLQQHPQARSLVTAVQLLTRLA